MATITINGEQRDLQLPASLAQLIAASDVEQPEMVSVQLNDEFVDRDDWDKTTVNEGDTVDFLYFMGGGCFVVES
ncbi:MAG: sulfur carrier protein ThiS [Prevotella sp.]|nr:sulfur carrier protein ThiS [Prevotella sp.]